MTVALSLFRQHALLVGLFLLCVVLHYAGFEPLLALRREQVEAGEVWRLFTSNFVHLNGNHLWMDMLGLLMIGFVFWPVLSSWAWLTVVVVSAWAVGALVWWLSPDLHWYVGISGVLHGMMAAGAIAEWRLGYKGALWLLFAVCAKLAYEQFVGPMPGSEEALGGRVAVDAHLYGMLGAVVACVWPLKREPTEPTAKAVDKATST